MLISAAQLFREKGIVETTLDEIAAGVGLTKPRLYFHFEDKHEILKTCVDRALCQWRDAKDEIRANNPQPSAETLNIIVKRYADIAFQDFGMCVIFNGIRSMSSDEREVFSRQKSDVDAEFRSLLAGAIRPEMLSRTDSGFLWIVVMSLVHGIAMLKEPLEDKQQILSRSLNMILAGLSDENAAEIPFR